MDYTILEVLELLCHTWHKDSGTNMKERQSNGLVICDGSEFSFYASGKEIIADSTHLLVLPKGASYHFICRKTGVTYTYNFRGSVPGDKPYSIETDAVSKCIFHARELRKADNTYTKIGLMYNILGDALGNTTQQSIPDLIKPQLDYIHKNFWDADISNGFLASLTNISEVYFRKLFVKTLAATPHEYIVNLRIEKAKRMLLEGKNVSQTAFACGFSNLYYFSGAFKKIVRVSPSEYAKMYGVI